MLSRTIPLTISLILHTLLAGAQQTSSSGFVINGYIEGIKDGDKVSLYDIDEQVYLDHTITTNGRFVLKGKVERPVTCWIRYKDEYAIIQVENTAMEFRSPIKDMHLYSVIKGGPEQDLQNQLNNLQHRYKVIYYGAYDSLTQKKYRDKAEQQKLAKVLNDFQDKAHHIFMEFGKRHPNTYIGLDILYRNRERIGNDTIEALLTQMDDDIKFTAKGQALALFAYGVLAEKGKPFIDFEAETLNG